MTFTIQFNTIQISNTTKKIVLPYNIIMTGRGTAQIATLQFGQTTISNNTIFTTGQAIAKGTNIYYAVGSGTNTIAYTTDTGNTWTGVTSAPFTTSGYDILNLGSVWIAAGEGTNALAYYNNTSWLPITTTGLTSGRRLYYDLSLQRIYAMGVGSNTFAYAATVDGAWSGIKTYVLKTQINAFGGPSTYNSRVYVASTGDQTNPLMSSTTPNVSASWVAAYNTSGTQVFFKNSSYVFHGTDSSMNKLWVAVGGFNNQPATTVVIGYSNTGTGSSWTGLTQVFGTTGGSGNYIYGTSLAYGSDANGISLWVAGAYSGVNSVAYTRNGAQWTGIGFFGITYETKIAFGFNTSGNPLWVATYGNTLRYNANGTDALSSWTTATGTASCSAVISEVKCGTDGAGNTLWVLVGSKTGSVSMGYSTDGCATWTAATGLSIDIGGVEYGSDGSGNPLWVANGTLSGVGKILYSSNGKNWTTINSPFTSTASKVSYGLNASGKPQWIITAGAASGGYNVAFSPNGQTWTSILLNTGTGATSNISIVSMSCEPKYILGGTGAVNMKGSFDGTTWFFIQSPFSVATNDVQWYSDKWVAVGEGGNTIAYSTDGRKWIGNNSVFTVRGNRVQYISNQWIATGEGTNTLAQSENGIGWSPIITPVDISGAGFCEI